MNSPTSLLLLSSSSRRLFYFSRTRPRLPTTITNIHRLFTPIAKMGLITHVVPEAGYIDGKWVEAKSGKTFDVYDPATLSKIGNCPEMSREDAQEAIKAAARAFKEFSKKTPKERATLLRNWYNLVLENADDLATLITWENGKPLNDAKSEVKYSASFLEWFSEEAPRLYGDVISSSVPGNRIITLKQPIGVCGLITPWNFPAAMITRKMAPAIAAGCTVVCKTPGETPYSTLALAELSHRAGFPPGVINVITSLSTTPEVGKELCENKIIKKISFTGSTAVGKLLMQQCSSTLKKLSLELGGNAPFIVFSDADIDLAVQGAITSKFRSSGQTCVCANRIYVQKDIYHEFSRTLVEAVKKLKVGPGFQEDVTHGPLIHSNAIKKVKSHVEDAVSKGAKILHGGKHLEDTHGPNFFELTVLGDMTKDMQLHGEETFGPLAALFPFETEKEVVELANASDVGLAGYFYSRDVSRIWRVAEALEVGMVGVNSGVVSDVVAPFGGVKESGFGREGSKYGIDDYTIIKSITFGNVGRVGDVQG